MSWWRRPASARKHWPPGYRRHPRRDPPQTVPQASPPRAEARRGPGSSPVKQACVPPAAGMCQACLSCRTAATPGLHPSHHPLSPTHGNQGLTPFDNFHPFPLHSPFSNTLKKGGGSQGKSGLASGTRGARGRELRGTPTLAQKWTHTHPHG
jgi:hypothetical protein